MCVMCVCLCTCVRNLHGNLHHSLVFLAVGNGRVALPRRQKRPQLLARLKLTTVINLAGNQGCPRSLLLFPLPFRGSRACRFALLAEGLPSYGLLLPIVFHGIQCRGIRGRPQGSELWLVRRR